MKDTELIEKVKKHGKDTDAVQKMLLELLERKEITREQLFRCLDNEDGEWPYGYPYGLEDGKMDLPTFATRVWVKFERLQGDEQAFCC